jgi:hopene-associated glycosyltransferase HpnB
MFLSLAAVCASGVWLYLLLGRGGFWRMADRAPAQPPRPAMPPVVAVIPARNEVDTVPRSIASLARQAYPGPFQIVLVDDASSDGTAAAAAAVARSATSPELLTVLRAAPLPSGWTGKLWAVAQGVDEASRFAPEYFLLTDADICHPPHGLRNLVAQAEQDRYDLVSWMVTLHCQTRAERAFIPAFVFFFFMLYPPAWIRSERHRTAGAAGGCILIRRNMLERIGGIGRIRGELIDDCALARAVKQAGGRVWLGLSAEARSIRVYGTPGEIFRMIARTAFTQLRHSAWLLAGTVAGLTLTYIIPPVAALAGRAFGITAWALMTVAYVPTLRFYRRSVLWAPLLPLLAAFYLAATIHSALAYWRGAGGMWKGRAQAA